MRTTKTLSNRKRKNKWRDNLFYAVLVALPLLQFCVFYIGVNANTMIKAFSAYDIESGEYVFAGLEQFKTIIEEFRLNPIYKTSMLNSLKAYAIKTAVSLPVSLLLSYYIFKKARGYRTFRVLLFMPSIISPMVLTTVFKYVTDLLYPELMFKMTGEYPSGLLMEPDSIFPLALFYTIWVGFGVTTMIYRGAMDNVSPEMLEAATIDGAGEFMQFRKMILPMIFPTISVFLLSGIAGIFMDQINLYNLFAGSPPYEQVKTFGYQFFVETQKATLSGYPRLAAYGLILSAVTIPTVLLLRRWFNKINPMEG